MPILVKRKKKLPKGQQTLTNKSLKKQIDRQRENDVKWQIQRMIDNAKVALTEYESYSSKSNTPKTQLQSTLTGMYQQETTQQPSLVHEYHPIHSTSKVKLAIEEVIGLAAAKIAQDIDADGVISIERKGKNNEDKGHLDVLVSIFRRSENGYSRVEYQTTMRKVMSGSIVPIKELLMEAINKKYIRKGDRIVCVEDESLGMGYKGLLFIFDVDKIFFNISTMNLASHILPDVIESVINVCVELGKEGREGRKVGTGFIIGHEKELNGKLKQMIMNPFSGYPDEFRKISDPNIKETVKNFAQLDGTFVIDEKGTILTAGAHLNVDVSEVDLPGYGTRHRCSAAITKHTNSIAVVLSESGGITSIFKNGKLVMKLP